MLQIKEICCKVSLPEYLLNHLFLSSSFLALNGPAGITWNPLGTIIDCPQGIHLRGLLDSYIDLLATMMAKLCCSVETHFVPQNRSCARKTFGKLVYNNMRVGGFKQRSKSREKAWPRDSCTESSSFFQCARTIFNSQQLFYLLHVLCDLPQYEAV